MPCKLENREFFVCSSGIFDRHSRRALTLAALECAEQQCESCQTKVNQIGFTYAEQRILAKLWGPPPLDFSSLPVEGSYLLSRACRREALKNLTKKHEHCWTHS